MTGQNWQQGNTEQTLIYMAKQNDITFNLRVDDLAEYYDYANRETDMNLGPINIASIDGREQYKFIQEDGTYHFTKNAEN